MNLPRGHEPFIYRSILNELNVNCHDNEKLIKAVTRINETYLKLSYTYKKISPVKTVLSNGVVCLIDANKGCVTLVDSADADLVILTGSTLSIKHGKLVFHGLVLHKFLAEQELGYGLRSSQPIHHLNRCPYDNRRRNLIICENTFSHSFFHYNETGIELSKELRGDFNFFELPTPESYILNGVQHRIMSKRVRLVLA